ncbi:MAG TPA: hypothetical protein VJ044_05595, partial [Candidatus Hodarchaeales archaeon]|nr:hypothetical protein [Candidatus Hodarchaeales archaeon]
RVFSQELQNFSKFSVDKVRLLEIGQFPFKTFDFVGYLEINLSKLVIESRIQPPELNEVSQKIQEVITSINGKNQRSVFLDPYNPPYVINVGVQTNFSSEVAWTMEVIHRYRKELGKWIEFYSGQWADYSEELWSSRIENNLSNRLSEVHYIRVNSGFLYIPEAWWNDRGGSDLERSFIQQIIRAKALQFAFYVLNEEIDATVDRLQLLGDDIPLKILESEIKQIVRVENLVADLSDRLFKERIINRRTHSKNILNRCLNLLEIDLVRNETRSKTERLHKQLENARAVQQERLANQQKRWLLILNVILGSQVLFTIGDKLKEQLNSNVFIFFSIDSEVASFIRANLDYAIWIMIVVLAVLSTIGLIYSFVVKQFGFLKKQQTT